MALNISFREVTFTPHASTVEITVVTDIPCHLYCRLSETEPQIHRQSVRRRGVPFLTELRFCFVSYEDNEQDVEGDTLVHHWEKPAWGYCVTKWCYFWGYIGGVLSKSTSPIFKYHNNLIISTYTLNVSSTAGGEVTEPGEGSFEYDPDTKVDLVAEAEINHHFVHWNGDIENIDNWLSANTFITMKSPATIEAEFSLAEIFAGYKATLPTGSTYGNRIYVHTDTPANGWGTLIYLEVRTSGKPQNNITYAAIVKPVGEDTYEVMQAGAFSTPGVGVYKFEINWTCHSGWCLAFWQKYGSMRREYSLNHNKMSGYIYSNPLIEGENIYCPYDGESDKLRIYADNWTTI